MSKRIRKAFAVSEAAASLTAGERATEPKA